MAPRALGLGVTQITFLVNTSLASTLVTGSIVAYNVAFTILQIPLGVIGVPLGVVLLPSMSRAMAIGDSAQYAKLIVRALRLLLYVMLFLTAMTIVAPGAGRDAPLRLRQLQRVGGRADGPDAAYSSPSAWAATR